MNDSFNEGMYSDEKIAKEWVSWVKNFKPDDTRDTDIYPYISSWIHQNKPKIVLEIGSGSGICSEKIDLRDVVYIGIEPSLPLRDFAKRTYPNREFKSGKAESLPIDSISVDAAFSVFVWLHIADLDQAAKELSRVLTPGGSFVIVTANPDQYKLWLSWHSNMKVNGKEVLGDMKYLSGHHMFLHSLEEMTSSLEKYGLRVTSIFNCGRGEEDSAGPGFAVVLSGCK